jgi:galactokinase
MNTLLSEQSRFTHRTSVPGRICLFGEHQDYLGLPVIAAAINRRITIDWVVSKNDLCIIDLRDLGLVRTLSVKDNQYNTPRDYFISALNVLRKNGYKIEKGVNAAIYSDIPVGAGVSSSSALANAWLTTLLTANEYPIPDLKDMGEMAYQTEVVEFGEPGGRMDQYTTAIGGIIQLSTHPTIEVESLPILPGRFIIADGREEKDTIVALQKGKESRFLLMNKLIQAGIHKHWSELKTATFPFFSSEEQELFDATLQNRAILEEAYQNWGFADAGPVIGSLLLQQHKILSQVIGVSTTKIDQGIQAAVEAGAWGGKMLGSGIGGCCLIYYPDDNDEILPLLEVLDFKCYVVEGDVGIKVSLLD